MSSSKLKRQSEDQMPYDSRPDTYAHIATVRDYMLRVVRDRSTPRVIMVEGVPWVSHEFHERFINEMDAENERLREELGYRPSDTNGYCPACGRYQPKTLGGDETSCDCGRTPPSSNLPPNIYVCPVCHGHGASRFGCWGTQAKPHGHAYMRPMLELLVPKEDRPPQPDLMAALEASLRTAGASDEGEAS